MSRFTEPLPGIRITDRQECLVHRKDVVVMAAPAWFGRVGPTATVLRWSASPRRGRNVCVVVAACAAGTALLALALALVLGATAGSAWMPGAAAELLLVAAALAATVATTSTALRLLGACLDEADERLARQVSELARYAAVVAAIDDAVVTVSLDGLVTSWNPAAADLYGYLPDEVLGRPVARVFSAGAPEIVEATARVVAGERATFETVHLRGDGATLQLELTLTRICDRAGQVTGIVGIGRDIGDRKTREAVFQQESKLESLGRLSAGLAHEINSPIQFVGDNARFLEEAYQELIRVVEVYRGLLDTSNPIGWMERQERVREVEAGIDFDYLQKEIPSAVEQTMQGIERVSTIVRAMKTFSHPGHKEQVPADLNEAVEATVTVARHQINAVADLSLDLADLPPVRCNIADLNQVFLNLLVNAADAIEETGQRGLITVVTAVDGADVVIRIIDTGCGIPEEVLSKIFDPFFTTKDVGRGSGQGLPLVRGVVHEGHGGSLTVESVVGEGTTFAVRIRIDGLGGAEPLAAA
jgi:two-component system NtrC family sensor kinase